MVGIGSFPNLQRRGECLNSQWKEVGREEREKEKENSETKGKDEWKEGVNGRITAAHVIHTANCSIMVVICSSTNAKMLTNSKAEPQK